MPISGCHDLPLATFNSPVVNTRPTPEQPPRKKQHRHSGIFRVADLRPGTMPRGKYPESPAPAGSHALISRTPTPGGMLHANLGLPRPPPRNFQPPLPQRLPVQPQKNPPNQKPPRAVSPLTPRAVSPEAACVPDHSRGQALAPATAPSPTAKESPKTKTPSCRPPPPRRLGGGFNPLRGATTGVVIRRRATTGVDGTRGNAFNAH